MRQVALLRGINLGPRQRVSMPQLRELLGALGLRGRPVASSGGRGALITEERLGTTATARNWTTVCKLLALADAPV